MLYGDEMSVTFGDGMFSVPLRALWDLGWEMTVDLVVLDGGA